MGAGNITWLVVGLCNAAAFGFNAAVLFSLSGMMVFFLVSAALTGWTALWALMMARKE